MRHARFVLVVSALLVATVLHAQQTPPAGRGAAGRGAAAEAAPPAPPPGSAGTYKSGTDLMDVLKKNMSGEMTTSAVSNTDQYRVNIVHRVKPAGAIAHAGNTELHYIISGAATVVTGGTIVRPPAGSAGVVASIEKGVTKHVTKGDVVIVPEGSAHWYKDIEGEITYLEVRWLAPVKK